MLKPIVLPLLLAVLAAGVVAGYRPASAATTYAVSQVNGLTTIGVPYGLSADRSKIAGIKTTGSGPSIQVLAIVHSGGVTTDLGTNGFPHSRGYDVNDAGFAVGALMNQAGGFSAGDRGFLYSGGAFTVLPQLPTSPGLDFTAAIGINNSGRIIGMSQIKPFAYNVGDANLTPLALPATGDGTGFAWAINNAGRIVGSVNSANTAPATWDENGVLTVLPAPAGATAARARIIDDSGVIAGIATFANGTRAYFYDAAGNAVDMGTLGAAYDFSEVFDINSSRQAVGTSRLAAFPFTFDPFLYENGTMVNLNSLLPANSGWVLRRAISITDAGEIVGLGTFNGTSAGFRLTPIPEPTAVAGLALMALGAATCRRRPQNRRSRRPVPLGGSLTTE